MYKNIINFIKFTYDVYIIATLSLTILLQKNQLILPPIISVELIQITDQTNIPFAPKAKK